MQDQSQAQAVIQKPVKYIENYYGQAMRVDRTKVNMELEMANWPKFGQERMNTGSLPYTGSPRYRKNLSDRLIPEDTKMMWSRSCWNECLNQAGPWYLRHWQIWDYAPFVPTAGNVVTDPKYGGINTKEFTKSYKVTKPGITAKYSGYGIGGRNAPL